MLVAPQHLCLQHREQHYHHVLCSYLAIFIRSVPTVKGHPLKASKCPAVSIDCYVLMTLADILFSIT